MAQNPLKAMVDEQKRAMQLDTKQYEQETEDTQAEEPEEAGMLEKAKTVSFVKKLISVV